MMETLNGSSSYLQLVQHGVHQNFNSALYSLVTPPRRTTKTTYRKRMSPPVEAATPFFNEKPSNRSANRESPSRHSPSQVMDGKEGFYAGAKFGERPLPTELPPPPIHWLDMATNGSKEQSCMEITNSLKVLLKVQS